MKRLAGVAGALALAGAVFAAWSLAAPSGSAPARAAREASTAKSKLPPLPPEVRDRKRWHIGVKCDAPPFGYINVRGKNAGFDVEIARWFSRFAFGKANRIDFECTPTPAREPALTTGRVDIVIATFTYTADRDTRIDFSRAYYKATGRLLVRNDSPIHSLKDLKGRTVATTTGSIYDRWVRRCFPGTKLVVTDGFTNALLAFRDGRADTMMWDDTVLLGIATTDRALKLTGDTFLAAPYGIGIKQGNTAMKRWVDSRLELMRKRDLFIKILKDNVPARTFKTFSKNVLRPNNTFGYAKVSPETVCP
jgi:polar amino acid transport system substrate-binding protein